MSSFFTIFMILYIFPHSTNRIKISLFFPVALQVNMAVVINRTLYIQKVKTILLSMIMYAWLSRTSSRHNIFCICPCIAGIPVIALSYLVFIGQIFGRVCLSVGYFTSLSSSNSKWTINIYTLNSMSDL